MGHSLKPLWTRLHAPLYHLLWQSDADPVWLCTSATRWPAMRVIIFAIPSEDMMCWLMNGFKMISKHTSHVKLPVGNPYFSRMKQFQHDLKPLGWKNCLVKTKHGKACASNVGRRDSSPFSADSAPACSCFLPSSCRILQVSVWQATRI